MAFSPHITRFRVFFYVAAALTAAQVTGTHQSLGQLRYLGKLLSRGFEAAVMR